MALAIRQATPSFLRKHTDPPGLWMSVVLGSLVLNGALFMAFQRYLQPVETIPAFAPIAIDFVPANSQFGFNNLTKSNAVLATKAPAKVASANRPVINSNPSSVSAKGGGISIAAPSQPARDRPSDPPTDETNTERDSVSPEPTQGDPNATVAPSTTSPLSPPTSTEITEDQVATTGVLLPGFNEPPDPKANTEASTLATADAVSLSRKVILSKYLIEVTVLPLEGDRALEAIPNVEQTHQSKTLSSGEAGCFVTPEALHYFNQSLEYILTLNQEGMVVDAVPVVAATSDAQKSYQNLASCSLKTWTFEQPSIDNSPTQPSSKKLAVQVILQKQ